MENLFSCLLLSDGFFYILARKIVELLDAKVLCGEDMLDKEVKSACGCDMMSDVLAFVKEQAVLITGLCNPQVVRTAMMIPSHTAIFSPLTKVILPVI